jgi:hypothetical protein
LQANILGKVASTVCDSAKKVSTVIVIGTAIMTGIVIGIVMGMFWVTVVPTACLSCWFLLYSIKCNAISLSPMQCNAVQYQYNIVQPSSINILYDTMLFNTMQHNTIQYNTMQYDTTIQCDTIQHYTILYYTMLYNATQYNTIQCNTIQYDTSNTI